MKNICKGTQRRIIVIKDPGGKYFEQACFILKEGALSSEVSESDMVAEACRIIAKNDICSAKERHPVCVRDAVAFLVGALLSAFAAFVMALLFM